MINVIIYTIFIICVLITAYMIFKAVKNNRQNKEFRKNLNVYDKVRIPIRLSNYDVYLTRATITEIDGNFITVKVLLDRDSIYPI